MTVPPAPACTAATTHEDAIQGDTIAAIASGSGAGWRGIIRISGEQSWSIACRVCPGLWEGRLAAVPHVQAAQIELPEVDACLPAEVYIWPTHRSYTREPIVELHVLHSPPLLQTVLRACCVHGARLARPGEFTLRAFLAGRLDLTQVEAVLATIDAREGRELSVALQQLAGGLAQSLQLLRDDLLDLLADLEASLDFADEDLEFVTIENVRERLAAAGQQIRHLRQRVQQRVLDHSQPRIVLWGAPNAGKSSLFNALVRDETAVTHETAGTTRDFLVGYLHSQGRTCQLFDTAGWNPRFETGSVDEAAQLQAFGIREHAQLSVLCVDGHLVPTQTEWSIMTSVLEQQQLLVVTKSDLPAAWEPPQGALRCSAKTGAGIEEVRERLLHTALTDPGSEIVGLTAARCRGTIHDVDRTLTQALVLAQNNANIELLATEIRQALDGLGQVLGLVYTDDILDRVFSRFCIGK